MPVRTVELDSGTLDENSTTSSAKTNTSDTSTWNTKLVILICFMAVSALLLVLYYFVFSNRIQCCLGKQRRSRLRTMRYVVEPDQAANNGGEIAGNRDEFVEVALSSEENTSSKN
uniref:Membrane protein ORF59 n=1 Tax=Caenorhabditis tropicalis TaxID=1561998 RepID=A0A1I7TCB6_9PELO